MAATAATRRPRRPRLTAVPTTPDPVEQGRWPNMSDADEVREWADTLPDKYLQCRDLGHNWRPYDVRRHRDGGFERVHRCTSCRGRRYQHLTSDGMILGSRLDYPDGYLHSGQGRITGNSRGALRLASMVRGADLNALPYVDED